MKSMAQELRREAPAPVEDRTALVAQIYEARIAASSYLSTALLQVLVNRGVLQREDVASTLAAMQEAVGEQLAGHPDATVYAAEFEHIIGRIAAGFDLAGSPSRPC